ncbi:MAG: Holliday junction resolvase RuvX [Candidatus Marinimicrobia bacterium]|nr:Holliday junction resolvase RuvX [Candidatus Neomarinimicrobiota bacterium]
MGRILGLDYGDKRIGLAISDINKIIASPFNTILNESNHFVKSKINDIIIEKEIEYFVVGLPIGLNGKETEQTKKVRIFAKTIQSFRLPMYYQDERLSSLSAKRSLIKQKVKTGHNKHIVDQTAAAIFLQQFIDNKYK